MASRKEHNKKEKKSVKFVVLFHSSEALRAESVIKRFGIKIELQPIPRHLSSDCGFCLVCTPSESARVERVLREKDVGYDRIERLE